MHVLKVKIKPKLDRLDQFVSSEVKEITRSKAKKLIKDGFIRVNNSQTEPSYKISKGDSVQIEVPVNPEVSLLPEKIPLKIIFEDMDVIVVDKQPGLIVHPTLDHPRGTLVNALLSHLGDVTQEVGLRPGVVHRLDKDTSGLIVVAKNKISLENLKNQFKNREVHKKYLALVQGKVKKETGEVNGSIIRHPKFKSKFIVSAEGKDAITKYRVVERFGDNLTLLELEPLTGRTHQLRVHLSHIGHPIVGDKLYGGRMLLNRQFLHASNLNLKHPTTKIELSLKSGLPDDLDKLLKKLRDS